MKAYIAIKYHEDNKNKAGIENISAALEKSGISVLPGSLGEAIEITAGSELVKEALGDHIFEKFIDSKKIEWDAYRTHVSQFELNKYLPIL